MNSEKDYEPIVSDDWKPIEDKFPGAPVETPIREREFGNKESEARLEHELPKESRHSKFLYIFLLIAALYTRPLVAVELPSESIGPAPTDVDGNAGGAAGAVSDRNTDYRRKTISEAARKIRAWKTRIADLKSASAKQENPNDEWLGTANRLEDMNNAAKEELDHLAKASPQAFPEIEARLEDRFEIMQEQFARFAAE